MMHEAEALYRVLDARLAWAMCIENESPPPAHLIHEMADWKRALYLAGVRYARVMA